MAPPKTMAVSQQQQQHQQQAQQQALNQPAGRQAPGEQASKSRKRRASKPQGTVPQQQQQQQQQQPSLVGGEKQQVANGKAAPSGKENLERSATSAVKQAASEQQQQQQQRPAAPLERASIKKQQSNQVPSSPVKKEAAAAVNNNSAPARSGREPAAIVAPSSGAQLAKQISAEEPDDIDAGIELDGSSNSGSSVKDLNEDQIKSASVSPVMAQSSVVNEERDRTKHAVEVAPMGQLAGSLCQNIEPASKKASLTTKQQLAANQQVIDADEQQLQQKLQSKQQRKPSLQGNTSAVSLNTSAASAATAANASTSTSTASSLGAPQSPALCKICEQHVYQMERMMAEKAVYHKSCFRCHQCKTQLRIDNYSSHEGQVYCKAHHKQLLQPQVKLDSEDDVDIVAKSTERVVDDYLRQRGRLSDLSFSFLQPKHEEIQKRQMIICENEPAELPKDVVRSDTKVDDGIDRFSLNLNNILEKFERGNSGEDSQPASAGVNIEKPSFNLKKTLMAFETKALNANEDEDEPKGAAKTERPVVRKLANPSGFLNRQSSAEGDTPGASAPPPAKPLAVRRSESLMLRLKKYESRIAGEQVADDDDAAEEAAEDENNNNNNSKGLRESITPRKLSSLKSQWENGDISKRRSAEEGADGAEGAASAASDNCGGLSPAAEKNEELIRIRQQLARKRSGGSSSIRNIYENAIKEAQQAPTPKSNPSDLSALNGLSTTEIQQQLLQNGSHNDHKSSAPASPNKDHFQLNLSKRANKLRERFEQGLINNGSHEDSDEENEGGEGERNMSKLDQIRQEKLEDLSIFTEGEIKAREARSMFQQIDRRLSAAGGQRASLAPNSRSLATISASMQAKLQGQRNPSSESLAQNGSRSLNSSGSGNASNNHLDKCEPTTAASGGQKPIRLLNNVRT